MMIIKQQQIPPQNNIQIHAHIQLRVDCDLSKMY